MTLTWPIRRPHRFVSSLMEKHGHPIAVEYDREYLPDGYTFVPYCKGCNRNLCPPSRDVFIRETTFEDWPADVIHPVIVELIAKASDLSLCRCKPC